MKALVALEDGPLISLGTQSERLQTVSTPKVDFSGVVRITEDNELPNNC
jgi:hypothetical protein